MNWQYIQEAVTVTLYALLAIFILILLFYIFRAGLQGQRILVTRDFELLDETLEKKDARVADQYYYLPTASLVLKVRATVAISRSVSGRTRPGYPAG